MTSRRSTILAGLSGALFGAGLLVAGMTRPDRVVAFLDPLGGWDPSLAFVMAGAIAFYAIAYRRIMRDAETWFGASLSIPQRTDLDLPLVAGAALFGIGWGLVGLCPGPGLVAAGAGRAGALLFVAAMATGMLLHHKLMDRVMHRT